MIVCLLKNEYISSVELPAKVQGQFWLKDQSSYNQENVIAIEGIGNDWILKANNQVRFEDGSERTILKHGIIYRLKEGNHNFIYVYIEDEYKDSYFLKYQLNFKEGIITLGRKENNTIRVDNQAISGNHLSIFYRNRQWHLKDNESTNGTFVNYSKVKECDLKIGDMVYVLGVKMIIGDGFICINKSPIISLDQNDFKLMHFDRYRSNEEVEAKPINYFYRSPRVKKDIQVKRIELDIPPDNQIGEEVPLMLVIGPSMTMGMASLSTGIFAISNAISSGNISNALPSIVMSLSMLLGTVMWPILSKRYEKKRKKEKEEKRQIKYGRYLDQKEKEIAQCANEQMIIWNENFPDIDECLQRIETWNSKLFERNMSHNDFLDLRVGLGKRKVALDLQYSKKSFSLAEDSLKERLYSICEREKVVDNVPITISLLKQYILGIVGDKEAVRRLLNNLLIQLLSYYGYDEVKLVFIYGENDHQFDCVKWLPFVFDNKHENRFIIRNTNELKEISSYFENIINQRKDMSERDLEDQLPYYVIINLDIHLGTKADFVKNIVKLKQNIHFSIINVCEELKDLPSACRTVIEVSKRSGNYYDLTDMTGTKIFFVPDQNSVKMETICKKIANINLDLLDGKNMLPNMLTFLQMYNVGKVEHLNALTRWNDNDPTLSLEAPVGINNLGELFNLDLHEKYHGPHGLVAGMTGSGKSEFIMTYILSLAVNYHPYEVAFILIDYKGGGMAKAFEKLPHTAGIITNLDGASVNRSLVSIQSELKRRQSIFAATGKRLSESNIDIYKYQSLYRQGKVPEPLQHLFIISDEFAELKTQQPDFMEQLVSTARIGRSLGIHLILATQKPSGVVDDQIWSNSRFRICLKVQERADSMDMLKRPDAAEISQTGRFYLQVGYNELFELGQSAWAGAKYYPSDKPIIEKDDSVDVINSNGRIIKSMKINRRTSYSSNKQLDEITSYLKSIADEEKIFVRSLWLPPISKDIYVDEFEYKYQIDVDQAYVINPIVGEYDDPSRQVQGILTLPITNGGNTIIYGTGGSGKTTYLTTLIYSLTNQYTPNEVNIYVLDFASETLKSFQSAPHVGDILLSYEEEKINNLFKMLVSELNERKKVFANYGGDIQAYNFETSDAKASIIIIIHNYTAFSEVYESMEDYLSYLTREGAKYGIYFIVTTTSTTGIRFKMLQNFSQSIALQMNEDSDYSTIVGKTDGLVPMNYLGRGLIKYQGRVLEFQTAKVSRDIITYKEIEIYSESLNNKYSFKVKSVPVLPKFVDYEFIKSYLTNDCDQVPIGIENESLEPFFYDFKKDYLNYIVINERRHENNIRALLELMPDNEQFIIFDKDNILRCGNRSDEECKKGIDDLFDLVLKRNNDYKESSNVEETLASYDHKMIIIYHLSSLLESLKDVTKEKLELILEKGRAIYNINILIIEDSNQIGYQSYKEWFKNNVDTNNVIWLGNGIVDQYVFSIENKRAFDNIAKDFAIVAINGEGNKVKFISKGGGE